MSAASINKAEIIESIKEWMRIDNEIRNLNKEVRDRKTQQTNISKRLMTTMKDNNIDEFNVKEGKLIYSKKQVKKPITKKYLTDVLLKYYDGNAEQATELNSFIDENREATTKESIRRLVKPISKSEAPPSSTAL
jgi:hypothetical protein